ncbi:MAG: hypothetical protein K8F25_05165, partial [Fimbriimonadaceae bacterium]|nr:hypothetical protein [Alphaproteobacteria bacterium]
MAKTGNLFDDLASRPSAPASQRVKTAPKMKSGQAEKQENGDYTAADIEVLEGLEPVRRRPGMYIG